MGTEGEDVEGRKEEKGRREEGITNSLRWKTMKVITMAQLEIQPRIYPLNYVSYEQRSNLYIATKCATHKSTGSLPL